jgi:hypothetical protein
MDEQLDIVSSAPRWGHGGRWPGPGRSGWFAILAIGGTLAGLGLTITLALRVADQNHTIDSLHAAVQNARQSAPATAPLPTIEASAAYALPGTADGSFSVVAVGIRPKPGSEVRSWLFAYARDAHPAEHYGLRQATCTGHHITTSALADATADQDGNLTIAVPNLASNIPEGTWVEVYRWADGTALGGIQGPLLGRGATTFLDAPSC